MEALQPSRPPMSQQPPQRIDGINNNNNNSTVSPTLVENKEADKAPINNNTQQATNSVSPTNQSQQQQRDTNIPANVDISIAYKRRSLKHRVEHGFDVKIGKQEIEELAIILGPRKCQMYKSFNNDISSCVVCDEQCNNGQHAIETVLFIPNKNDPAYDNLGRFRIELPRIICHECSAEYVSENNITLNKGQGQVQGHSLGRIWQMYQNGELNQNKTENQRSNQRQSQHQNRSSSSNLSGIGHVITNPISPIAGNTNDDDNKNGLSEQPQRVQPPLQPQQQQQQVPQQGGIPNVHEAERDPFDDGFLICTQLVKTGGADQGGLQVGDVFVEFGHYSKKRFPGLKSIANLVRRSAGKEINVVVWRKLEQMNGVEDDGTGRTVFQKLALKLKPLQSHDADGGGVLGAVINTYPLPEMKN